MHYRDLISKNHQPFLITLPIEKRIDFIAAHPEAGKASQKRKNVRCVLLPPHSQIYYRFENETIEILLLFDMRQNPKKNPY